MSDDRPVPPALAAGCGVFLASSGLALLVLAWAAALAVR